jgi:hypothetical protein
MTDEGITVVIDNGELVEIGKDCIETLQDIHNDYLVIQQEIRITRSVVFCILVFVGACLGALIFRHLRK